MKIAVIGDLIIDQYVMGTAHRLCPEAPVPVVVPIDEKYETRGGAGLVADQLKELVGDEVVLELYGSKSRKERTFVDGRLVLRVDYDSLPCAEVYYESSTVAYSYGQRVMDMLRRETVSMVVIADYGKGAFKKNDARNIMLMAEALDIPVLVDAKHNFDWYNGAYAVFPNQHESTPFTVARHVIQKLGADGCSVDGVHVPGYEYEVRDVTGAGDIFLAAFAAKLYFNDEIELSEVAAFANIVAGLSVKYVGTHVVSNEEIEEFYVENGETFTWRKELVNDIE